MSELCLCMLSAEHKNYTGTCYTAWDTAPPRAARNLATVSAMHTRHTTPNTHAHPAAQISTNIVQ